MRVKARSSPSSNDDTPPPFLPLEESMGNNDVKIISPADPSLAAAAVGNDESVSGGGLSDSDRTPPPKVIDLNAKKWQTKQAKSRYNYSLQTIFTTTLQRIQSRLLLLPKTKINGKKIVMAVVACFFASIIFESFFVQPDNRLIQPDFADTFLAWVQTHPGWGLGAISLVIAAAVVTMIPIGTPLTLGCGYIYRGVYGWKLGLFVATTVSMVGSCMGAVACFLLGRYLMRDTVQHWVRNYPLFDAINVAAKEQGLKIMAMLYLTPVIPLGLVSYMCGTTSMNIYSFTVAKIFSLPLYLIYTFIGASAHSFIKRGASSTKGSSDMDAAADPQQQENFDMSAQAKQLEENQFLIVSGILLSLVMMTLITRHIRKELMKILEQQKKDKPGIDDSGTGEGTGNITDDGDDTAVEMGLTTRRRGVKTEMAD